MVGVFEYVNLGVGKFFGGINIASLAILIIPSVLIGLGAWFLVLRPLAAKYRVHFATYKVGRDHGVGNLNSSNTLQYSDKWGFIVKEKGLQMLKISGVKDKMALPKPVHVTPNLGKGLFAKPKIFIQEDINGHLHYATHQLATIVNSEGVQVENPLIVPDMTNEKDWYVVQTEATNSTYNFQDKWDKILKIANIIAPVFLVVAIGLAWHLVGDSLKASAETAGNAAVQIAASLAQIKANGG